MFVEASDEQNFINCGGNSLKALIFLEDLESEFKKYSLSLNSNRILDALLNQSFLDLVNLLNSELFESNSQHPIINDQRPAKRAKIENNLKIDLDKDILCWLSKCNHYDASIKVNAQISTTKYELTTNWRVDTSKCVDATPLILVRKKKNIKFKYSLGLIQINSFVLMVKVGI